MMRARLLVHLAGACTLTAGYAALISDWSSPTPELRFDDINRALYMLTAFPIFGVVVGELGWALRVHGWRSQVRPAIALALLCLVALARLWFHVPLSGHLALSLFALVWTISLPAGLVQAAYRLGFLLAALWFAWVHDAVTDLAALIAGLGLGALGFARSSRR